MLRYEYFLYVYPQSLQSTKWVAMETMKLKKKQITFIFEDNIFLHLSGPIGQIYAHNKMSDVFNLGLVTPVAYYSLPMFFFHHFKISLIFMNMQMR